jgi:hypothetical protein
MVEGPAQLELVIVDGSGWEADIGSRGTTTHKHDHASRCGRGDRGAPSVGPADGLEDKLMAGELLGCARSERCRLIAPLLVVVGNQDRPPLAHQ